MVGDIIRLKKWAFEVVEIHKNSVSGRLLTVGFGVFVEAWAKVKPYALTPDVLEAIGFVRVEVSTKLWVYERDDFKAHYDIEEHSLSVLSNPAKIHGFGFFYIYTLHELMQIFRRFNFETCGFYNRMRDYVPPHVI